MQITNNIFHGFVERTISLEFATNLNFTNNIISYSDKRKDIKSASPPANFAFFYSSSEKTRTNVRITDNAIYGFVEFGWALPTGPCDSPVLTEAQQDA